MAAPSVTYSFTNGTTADATQVNTNFTDLINGASDGTKDYTINALVVNGAATFNGAVTLGNASGDAITVTGSLSASLPLAANATYDIGGSTTGLAGLYLGNNTRTTRLVAGTITSSYTLTLPPAVPTKTGMFALFDTNATMSFRFMNKITAEKSADYTATSDETVIPVTASAAARTVTLPAASGNSGMIITVIKTDSTFNAVTVDGDGSETINGSANTTLNTQYESVTVICDGTGWYIRNRYIPSTITAYTPTFVGMGTATSVDFTWQRDGRFVVIQGIWATGTVSASLNSITLPTGLTTGNSVARIAGWGYRSSDSNTAIKDMSVMSPASSTTFFVSVVETTASLNPITQYNGNTVLVSSAGYYIWAKFEISGWKD